MWQHILPPMMPLLSLLLCVTSLLAGDVILLPVADAFSPPSGHNVRITSPVRNSAYDRHPRLQTPIQTTILFESYNNDDDDEPNTEENIISTPSNNNSLLQRFLEPKIDDPGLPLTDILLAQIVAPTFQIYWLVLNQAPLPSWLQPISSYFGEAPELAPRGSLLAPALIHGAGLAVCWLLGALAAKSFEQEAFTLKGDRRASIIDNIGRYDTILVRLVQAGAFASGILIFSTQMDLLLEFGRYVQYGESEQTDLRLLVATVEVINDIFWEAVIMSSWRLIHANFMSTPQNRERQF